MPADLHSAACGRNQRWLPRGGSGFDLRRQHLQPDEQVNHRDGRQGSHAEFPRTARGVNRGNDRHVRPGDLQGPPQRVLSVGSLRQISLATECPARGRRPVLRGRDAPDPRSYRFGCGGGGAAGRVPGRGQHSSLGHLERGAGAADCRTGRGDGGLGLRPIGGGALPVVHGCAEPADSAWRWSTGRASACTLTCT